jgi:hypothetical protein
MIPNSRDSHGCRAGRKGHNYDVSVAYQADSLRQLNYWATYLFSENGLS